MHHGKAHEIVRRRREEIKKLIEDIGLWNVNQTEISKHYNVTPQMISKDVHKIMSGMPAENLNEIKFNLKTAYKKGMREMQKILATSTSAIEKARAAQVIGNLGKQYTEMLENYGLKERIADKLEVQGQLSVIDQLKSWMKPKNTNQTSGLSSTPSNTSPMQSKSDFTSAQPDSKPLHVEEDGESH